MTQTKIIVKNTHIPQKFLVHEGVKKKHAYTKSLDSAPTPSTPFNSQLVLPFVSVQFSKKRVKFVTVVIKRNIESWRCISNHSIQQDFMVRFDQSASPRNSNEWVTININSQEFLSSAPQFSQTR